MKILVTGGAGYIGSAAVKSLIEKGQEVVVVDNLSKGKKKLVDKNAIFYETDLIDKEKLEEIFKKHQIDAIIHFAAYKAVGESMSNASKYSHNITGTINLLDCMVKFNVKKLIFSSSAAVYGMPDVKVIDENITLNPINYYGFTKLECERIIEWYNKVHNIQYINLRYFNVVGDAGLKYIDPEAENIFPIIMEVITGKREKLVIFGNDYNTEDGTCVRDYIDVNDLVDAHILALTVNYNGSINLGTGNGFSVKQLVEAFMEVTGKKFKYEYGDRRPGDPAALIASNEKAAKILKWKPRRSLREMIKTTYEAYQE